MKTSEIKNFANQSSIRPGKLKFNQTKLDQEDYYFSADDHKKALLICKSLKQAKEQNKPINKLVSQLNYQLMFKLSKFIELQDPHIQKNDSSHLKFRIVKSAKKINQNIYEPSASQHLEKKPIKLKPLTVNQNKSQIIFNKENLAQSFGPTPQGTPTQFGNRRKFPQTFQTPKKKKNLDQQRDRFKSQLNTQQKMQKQLSIARQTVDQKNQENKKLRAMLYQMQSKENNQQPLSIPFKIYLQYQEKNQKSADKNNSVIKIPLNKPTQTSTPSIQKQEFSHLKLITVCQHKQIQNLQQKLIQEQNKGKSSTTCKKQRWESY